MRKGIRKINLLSSLFFVLLLVLVIFNRLTTSQVPPQEQDLEKENPIAVYLAYAVFSVEDLLIVEAGYGLKFFNNEIKENPLYLGEYNLDYSLRNYINEDDQLFMTGRKRNDSTFEYYKYFAVYIIKENASLELTRDYNLSNSYREFIILENDTSMVLTVNEDRQSLSLFNCTDTLVELSLQYNHELFFSSNDVITKAIYEEDYLVIETFDSVSDNRTLAMFDITNHTNLELLLSWSVDDTSSSNYDNIAIEGDRLYLTSYRGSAKVFTIAENRSLEETYNFNTGHTYNYMKIVSNYMFLSTSSEIIINNITDLENIEQLGSYEAGRNQGSFEDFFVIDELIYISHFATRTDNLLILLDWSDPANPVFIRIFGYPHTDSVPFFTLAVPVVFLVFALGLSKHRKRRNKIKQMQQN
ncbi:MAG: hypothetical protein GPJ52_07955 [Candidatus Heimdallarchaeota archaeon]|nr:hypothetical protein [Candidatus Heimdallarchaeota archaeon]